MVQRLIVTHHSPDLDAITSVWLLKRFASQDFADAKVAFVDPGDTISAAAAKELGFEKDQITHTDTGLGQFDHHQPEQAQKFICATSLVYDYLCEIQADKKEDQALRALSEYVTTIDHFGEVDWPEAGLSRFAFTLPELIHGLELLELHNDDSQLHFGFTCLDSAYAVLKQYFKAQELLVKKAIRFELPIGNCVAIETGNDDVIKLAQKQGADLVIKKDDHTGHVRIKARPNTNFTLEALSERVKSLEPDVSWYYHPGGKMLLNGSRKHQHQNPSSLSLAELIDLVKELYG